MKLDLEDRNVFHHEMTVDEARSFGNDSDSVTKMIEALDEAQGFVFTDEGPEAFLIITIRK